MKKVDAEQKASLVGAMLSALGLPLLPREELRIRPKDAAVDEAWIDAAMERRKSARADKDFAASDAIREEMASMGVEVMDGDPLGWEWRLGA